MWHADGIVFFSLSVYALALQEPKLHTQYFDKQYCYEISYKSKQTLKHIFTVNCMYHFCNSATYLEIGCGCPSDGLCLNS